MLWRDACGTTHVFHTVSPVPRRPRCRSGVRVCPHAWCMALPWALGRSTRGGCELALLLVRYVVWSFFVDSAAQGVSLSANLPAKTLRPAPASRYNCCVFHHAATRARLALWTPACLNEVSLVLFLRLALPMPLHRIKPPLQTYVDRRKREMGERNQAANHSVNVVGQLKTELVNTAKVTCLSFNLSVWCLFTAEVAVAVAVAAWQLAVSVMDLEPNIPFRDLSFRVSVRPHLLPNSDKKI